MKHRRGWLLCAMACTAFGQQALDRTSPDTIFRTNTRLVEVSVIAQDKAGKPVRNLQRDEFHLYDNGSPQSIQLFLSESEKASPPAAPEAKAPNTFTNRISAGAASHAGFSVILIDNLFTIFGDPDKEPGGSSLARLQALQTLRSSPSSEKIAIYAVGRKLTVICEFTSDRDLLERQLAAWTPSVDSPTTVEEPPFDPANPPTSATRFLLADPVRIDALQRAASNNVELEQLADHLAGIPGRKNLIWLSTRFVIGPAALRKFSEGNVAIYPVDLDGVCYPGPGGAAGIPCPEPRPRELMNSIAARTGGVAFYGRNDLDMAMREARDDARASYMLGFYRPGDEKKPIVHRLGIQVDRPGLNLRYRDTYQAEAQTPVSGGNPTAELVSAMTLPIDSAVIPISASVTRTKDRLDLILSLDVSSLGLGLSEGMWKGSAELAACFVTADGVQAGEVVSQTVNFSLRPATYDSLVQSGVRSHKEMTIPEKASALKVLVGNAAAGRIGTLTIPLSEVESLPSAKPN